ncbi:MAG: hypothetical protein JKX92_05430 [Porticoccaceae bacterium]|nr:hypothetical protein [Porticoccaceae bacterium]
MKIIPATGVSSIDVSDVFSAWLYEGNGSTQALANGVDLSASDGLVWIKNRGQADTHVLADTLRGPGEILTSETTAAEATNADTVTAFNDDGFSIGGDVAVNTSAEDYASWTFRKAPRFFDIVTYTGDGVANRDIAHSLDTTVGMMLIKATTVSATTNDWFVYHASLASTEYLKLNLTSAKFTGASLFASTVPSATSFKVNGNSLNEPGTSYVAYLFAHDPVGRSGDGLIACGAAAHTNGTATDVDIGWEPQYILRKLADGIDEWVLVDALRGMPVGGDETYLAAHSSAAESLSNQVELTATGFILPAGHTSGTHIYMAIRRSMKAPATAGDVFAVIDALTATEVVSGFPVDWCLNQRKTAGSTVASARLRQSISYTYSSSGGSAAGADTFTHSESFIGTGHSPSNTSMYYLFKRAAGFFDVVAYTGDGSNGRQQAHSLGVRPELYLTKRHDASASWAVCSLALQDQVGLSPNGRLDSPDDTESANYGLSCSASTSTTFYLDNKAEANAVAGTYTAYLFATVAGISKCGFYTGTGGSQAIDCGFAAGARFVLVKRADSSGDWYIWDSVRGIVVGNDTHQALNTAAAEVSTDDSIDPASSGFIVNQNAATDINIDGAHYIYYAIA